MNGIKRFVILLLFLGSHYFAVAQLAAQLNIDQLTDQQLVQFVQANNLNGLSEFELETKAREKGLTNEQIQKLKIRLQALPNTGISQQSDAKQNLDNKRKGQTYLLPKSSPDSINGLVIFGSDFFTKENLSFEPNLNMPSPKNYVIGSGDELKIEIYGYSDKSLSLKMSPDGNIRYPNIGPINLSGLSLEAAEAKLTGALSKIYPGLKTGSTRLQVTLGQIRSIRVNLIGEVSRPGSYSISSLSTIANALYAAGGPSKIGSYRNISLIRNGKLIAQFDLYDYLINGQLAQNKMLQDEDVIKVPAYQSRVALSGAVKRNALYEIAQGDRLEQVLNYAGGLSDNANKSFIRIARYGSQEIESITVNANEASSFQLQTGDKLYVDSISSSFKNRVIISGAVNLQGVYSTDKIPDLKTLLQMAKPKASAYKERAILRRISTDYTAEIIGFNVNDVLNDKFNVALRKEDSIHIYPYNEIKETFKIQVRGEVNRPDSFYYAKGMLVQDAILMAGGYKDGANKSFLEISRRIRDTLSKNDSPLYSVILQADLSKEGAEKSLNTALEPFDIVSVRKSPGYKEQISVNIEGEVIYPGSYAISSNQERLSDLLKRAGGLKLGGYPEGAFLLRKTFENLSNTDTIILRNKLATLKNSLTDTSKARAADSTFKGDMKIVGIRLEEVIKQPGSLYDVILQEGDIIKVPKRVETVQTFSGVYFPKKIVYRSGLNIKDVIRESGGVLPGGQIKKAYVVYPNGEVRTTKHFLFFTNYPNVKPGSEVYVPVKQTGKGMSTGEVVALTTGLATLVTLFLTIRNLTQ
ncbi:MAG: hypothetical protein CFE25_01605 [Chitinophagaceae bacterium BSSC1]|nr:MAG: hypothetical protein CFE25_01605 [Chitinophagaceae bacterium BSSC1]